MSIGLKIQIIFLYKYIFLKLEKTFV